MEPDWPLTSKWCTCTHKSGRPTKCANCCTSDLCILSTKTKCVVTFVCEFEMSEINLCLYRCTMWKAHQWLSNGTVEQPCPMLRRLRRWDKNACQCAMHESAGKRASGMVFIYTSRSDREVLVQHAFGLPMLMSSKYVSVSVRVFRSEDSGQILPLPSYCWWAWIISTLPTAPILPLPVWTLWLCGSIVSLSTNIFSMPIFRFLQIVMLVGGDCVWSTCCRLPQAARV